MFPLQKDEKVLMYIRRHWIWLFLESKIAFFVFLIPTLLILYFSNYTTFGSQLIFGISGFAFSNIFISMWAIFCWIYMAERFTDYALNFWVLTNQRIVECELDGLFNRKINTMEIEDVEDASVTTPGFFAQFFGYGTLQIQSAGATREFVAEQVKDAEVAKQMVFALKARIKDDDIITLDEMQEIFDRNKVPQNSVPEEIKNDVPKVENVFDWAKVSETQARDMRNKIEEIESVDDKFKKDASDALKF
jgi:uncharacterized membrane protein YdbT with pleckstrin-like domain